MGLVYHASGEKRRVVTKTANGISASCTNGETYVRVVGRGTFQNGAPLRRFALEKRQSAAT
jgi:hypothetical protein